MFWASFSSFPYMFPSLWLIKFLKSSPFISLPLVLPLGKNTFYFKKKKSSTDSHFGFHSLYESASHVWCLPLLRTFLCLQRCSGLHRPFFETRSHVAPLVLNSWLSWFSLLLIAGIVGMSQQAEPSVSFPYRPFLSPRTVCSSPLHSYVHSFKSLKSSFEPTILPKIFLCWELNCI